MNLKIFEDIPPWEWPEDAAKIFLVVLGDDQTDESDRLLAVELAGDSMVINDELAEAASEAMIMTEAFFGDEDDDESPH